MSKLSRIWAGAVAYVSLLFGAGLSVAGNLADTYRIRGHAADGVDIALAIGPPIATLLVAEMFVSAWPRKISIQSIRWFTTATVGALATIVSWSHINELLAARGQNHLVAILWPLAIDGVAIMAMAKILVTRGHVAIGQPEFVANPLATDTNGQWPDADELAMMANHVNDQMATTPAGSTYPLATGHEPGEPWTGPVASEQDVAISEAAFRGQAFTVATNEIGLREVMATQPDDPNLDIREALDRWDRGYQEAIADLGQELAGEAEAFVNGQATVKSKAPVNSGVPEEARELLLAWASWNGHEEQPTDREVDVLLASHFGKSERTARRWRSIVLNQPTSGA